MPTLQFALSFYYDTFRGLCCWRRKNWLLYIEDQGYNRNLFVICAFKTGFASDQSSSTPQRERKREGGVADKAHLVPTDLIWRCPVCLLYTVIYRPCTVCIYIVILRDQVSEPKLVGVKYNPCGGICFPIV